MPEMTAQQARTLIADMRSARNQVEPTMREICDYMAPDRYRTTSNDRDSSTINRGYDYDGAATNAVRTARSGLYSGLSNPSSPWFTMQDPSPELNAKQAVREFYSKLTQRARDILHGSNYYRVIPLKHGDDVVVGNSLVWADYDPERVCSFRSLNPGMWSILRNRSGETIAVEYVTQLTVHEIQERFPDADYPPVIKQAIARNKLAQTFKITHLVCSNPDYDPSKLESKHKKWASLHMLDMRSNRTTANTDIFHRSGYDVLPALAGFWEDPGEDTYCQTAPGWVALGPAKVLHDETMSWGIYVEQSAQPKTIAPTGTKLKRAPGSTSYSDKPDQVRPYGTPTTNPSAVLEDMEQRRERINSIFYRDVFRMFSTDDRRQQTAAEVFEKSAERLLELGPVTDAHARGFGEGLFDILFHYMLKAGMVPEIPEEIQSRPMKIDFTGPIAQAQRLSELRRNDTLLASAANLATFDPSVSHRVDAHDTFDDYAQIIGVRAQNVRSKDEALAIAQQIAQAEAAQAAAEMAATNASTAQTLSQIDTRSDSALKQMIDGV